MYRIALAIACAALGCEKASSPKTSGSGDHACPREEFERWWTKFKSVSIPYFSAIQAQVPRWSNCETARIDLIALAPLSSEYERVMRLNLEWMHLQGGACDDFQRIRADNDDAYAKVHADFQPMAKAVYETRERCSEHPGFREAFRDGILFMQRRPD
ncbi:MAG: hypothetical protein AB7L94_23625 [Kofleriaceae bacterium]